MRHYSHTFYEGFNTHKTRTQVAKLVAFAAVSFEKKFYIIAMPIKMVAAFSAVNLQLGTLISNKALNKNLKPYMFCRYFIQTFTDQEGKSRFS